jgi:hypothetical protein
MPLNTDQPLEGAWIEAFKVGQWTDSAGNTDNWTPEKIDALLGRYNPSFHMAPVRIDHTEPGQRNGRGPAFGWIAAAKREGERVMVKLSQVQPQFEQWVRSGLVKFRSIAWDQVRGIHHLAFLGHNCPAIPGMENVYGDRGGEIVIESLFSHSAMFCQGNTAAVKIVDSYEATDILGRKTHEFINAENAQGRIICFEVALMTVVEQINLVKIPATGGRLFGLNND